MAVLKNRDAMEDFGFGDQRDFSVPVQGGIVEFHTKWSNTEQIRVAAKFFPKGSWFHSGRAVLRDDTLEPEQFATVEEAVALLLEQVKITARPEILSQYHQIQFEQERLRYGIEAACNAFFGKEAPAVLLRDYLLKV